MKLFHATSSINLNSIKENGLRKGSYFSNIFSLYRYYCDTIIDEGDTPVLLEVDMNDLNSTFFSPDIPGIQEPITTAIGLSESQVWSKWTRSRKTWKDSLRIVGSVRYDDIIPVCKIRFDETIDEDFQHKFLRRSM